MRVAKWIEPYISNLTNQDSNYLLNSWKLFESQLFNLFGDSNEVRKAEDAPAPVGESQGIGRQTLSQSDQPASDQSEPALLAITQQMTQIMANLQEASSSE
ncbi:hypothetical protein O181_133031 [Austropuccinia psidii MF-1]|uniref:Uncharacterized protein n=1 Tax=Austropuccinia psidii MF-1 TaxID=1389203 RepID=A0A9Q3QBP8_9BASI|nr:hypothetical protein [Austropuccinia psidii MF-1]